MLSKEKIEQIRKDAEDVWSKADYIAGATVEAQRAEVLVKALDEIKAKVLAYHKLNGDNPAANHCRNIAMEAIEQYNSKP